MKRFTPYLIIAMGILFVTNTVEQDKLDGLQISLGLWTIVIGIMIWVERTDGA